MKWQGAWCGVQILAEDKEEKELLEKLQKKLGKTERYYDYGECQIVTESSNTYDEFSQEEIDNAEFVIQILR